MGCNRAVRFILWRGSEEENRLFRRRKNFWDVLLLLCVVVVLLIRAGEETFSLLFLHSFNSFFDSPPLDHLLARFFVHLSDARVDGTVL